MSEVRDTPSTLPRRLNMGIWWNDGEKVWLPKEFCETRNDAKRFAVAECYSEWINIRVRTVWIVETPDPLWAGEYHYRRATHLDPPTNTIECWEIDT